MSNEIETKSKPSSSLITVLDESNTLNSNLNDNNNKETVEQLETSGAKRSFLEVNNAEKYKQFLIKPLETKRLKPSDTLDKVRQFLPMLKESTSKLLDDFKSNPDKLNIENVEDDDEEHIEMNLALVSDSDSCSEDDEDDEDSDDEDKAVSNKNKLKEYLKMLNGNGAEVDEDDDDDDESESSEPNPLDDLQLGFKVKNPNEIRKLKTSLDLDGKKSKRNLIKVIETKENCKEEEEEKSKTSDSLA